MQVSTKFTIALHILNAVETSGQGELFNFHEKPNPNCPVGKIFIGFWMRVFWKCRKSLKKN